MSLNFYKNDGSHHMLEIFPKRNLSRISLPEGTFDSGQLLKLTVSCYQAFHPANARESFPPLLEAFK
jgi:hypothetical protein